jgi:glycosyltransferase involved in cell wall biosynthesis
MIVVEASAKGVPAVVVSGEDNAATELIADGENGFVVRDADETQLADAIAKCIEGGAELRKRTRLWYAENHERLSLSHSLSQVVARYAMVGSTAKLSSVSSTPILERSGVA